MKRSTLYSVILLSALTTITIGCNSQLIESEKPETTSPTVSVNENTNPSPSISSPSTDTSSGSRIVQDEFGVIQAAIPSDWEFKRFNDSETTKIIISKNIDRYINNFDTPGLEIEVSKSNLDFKNTEGCAGGVRNEKDQDLGGSPAITITDSNCGDNPQSIVIQWKNNAKLFDPNGNGTAVYRRMFAFLSEVDDAKLLGDIRRTVKINDVKFVESF